MDPVLFGGVNWPYWATQMFLRFEEAAALLSNREPGTISVPASEQYDYILGRLRRDHRANLVPCFIRPLVLMNWADVNGIEFPAALRNGILAENSESRGNQSDKGPANGSNQSRVEGNLCVSEDLNPKTRTSLLTMIYAMSREQYGYDPNYSRNKTAALICSDAELWGQHIDPGTVNKWLRAAAALFMENVKISAEDQLTITAD